MSTFPKVGLEALLTPENCAVVLIDHQRSQLANVSSHDPTLVINNVTALAKTAKAYGVRPRRRVRHCAGMGDGYVTGVIEFTSGIALLVPAAAVFGALLLIPTMLGANVTDVFVVRASPLVPLLLLLGAAAVAWNRRYQLRVS